VFASAAAACTADADAEVAHAAQYDERLATTLPAYVRRVFEDT